MKRHIRTEAAREGPWFEHRGQVDEEVRRKRLTEEIVQRRLAAAREVLLVAELLGATAESRKENLDLVREIRELAASDPGDAELAAACRDAIGALASLRRQNAKTMARQLASLRRRMQAQAAGGALERGAPGGRAPE